jgi:CheY-like chemotaxis protein
MPSTEPDHTRPTPAPWVLYVGDRAVNIMLLEAIFERRPHLNLVVTTQGEHALHLAESLRPVLVLLDLELTGCEPRALLQRLRQRPGCEQVPVVAVSADHDIDIGGTDFTELWGKPLGPRQVFDRLDALTAAAPLPPERPLPASRRVHPDGQPALAALH